MADARSRRKRQAQLSFSPLPTSSPVRSSQPESIRDRVAFVRLDGSPNPSKRRRLVQTNLPAPGTSTQESRPARTSSPLSRRTTRSFLDGASSSPAKSQVHQPKRMAAKPNHIDSFDDSESDEPVMLSSPMRKKKRFVKSKEPKDEFVVDDDEVDELSDHEDLAARPHEGRSSANIDLTLVSSDEDIVPSSSRRKHKSRPRPLQGSNSNDGAGNQNSDDEEDSLPVSSKRRTLHSSPPASNHPRSQRDQADIDEDLEFLGVADVSSPRALRQGAGSQKQNRRDMLQALRDRRLKQQQQANTTGTVLSDEQDDDSFSDVSEVQSFEHDDQDGYELEQPDAIDDEDFIEEDDPDAEKVTLPFEFSNFNTMKPKELFKFAVEWMVQKKINPAFAIEDDVYDIAFRRLDDYVRGMGNSKFQSSVWTARFSKSLTRRPLLVDFRTGYDPMHDRCDACNRSGHPATWEVRFKGNTYNKDTLEEDSDDEDDEEPDVPSPRTRYYIGKTCMANARTAHALTHWRYHLNDWVVDYLRDEGELTTDKIVARDGWKTKKRRKDAERIVDEMAANGEIRKLYRDFKSEIETAQNVNNTQSRLDLDMSSP